MKMIREKSVSKPFFFACCYIFVVNILCLKFNISMLDNLQENHYVICRQITQRIHEMKTEIVPTNATVSNHTATSNATTPSTKSAPHKFDCSKSRELLIALLGLNLLTLASNIAFFIAGLMTCGKRLKEYRNGDPKLHYSRHISVVPPPLLHHPMNYSVIPWAIRKKSTSSEALYMWTRSKIKIHHQKKLFPWYHDVQYTYIF